VAVPRLYGRDFRDAVDSIEKPRQLI